MRRVAWSTRAVLVAVLAVGCAVASGLFGGGVVGGGASIAGAAPVPAPAPAPAPPPPLSPGGVELTTSLQGFTPAPAGAFNGPVSTSTLLTYTTDPDVLEEIEDGSVSVYIRTWSRPYVGSDDDGIIADLVVEFPNSADTAAFLDGLQGALSTQSAVTTFSVASPRGAEGYAAHGVIVPNSTDVAVSLGRGDFATFVMAATPAGNVSRSQVELVAAAQWGQFPSGAGAASTVRVALPTKLPALLPASDLSSSSAGGVEALLVVVVAVVGVVVLVLWAADFVGRRQRRRGRGSSQEEVGLDAGDSSGADDPGVVEAPAADLGVGA